MQGNDPRVNPRLVGTTHKGWLPPAFGCVLLIGALLVLTILVLAVLR